MFGGKKRRQAQALLETGARAVGTVTDVADTGMTINDNPRIRLTFRIAPLDGSAAFEGVKKATVSRVAIPRIGDRFPVFYDPADPGTFAYVGGVDGAEGVQGIVSRFGDAFGADASGIGQPAPSAAAAAAEPAAADPLEQLRKLGELRAAGVLTEAEFEQQKARILGG
ncbi:SHOCT domain-containing protein [Patulibacter defluvii]|uniref:SHOCT domain-containing protein n=1 Tax=Patulibacter defluvii TaxID=3095358 RepID=UPI002A763B19|nr:SHOCT domain-containing protein [Patulibacter sp. DM4]